MTKKTKNKWYTPDRMRASKKNIKKASKVWDEMSYSVAEGNIPKTLRVKNQSLHLFDVYNKKPCAKTLANSIRKQGMSARVKTITIGGTSIKGKHIRKRDVYAIYTSCDKK